MNMQLSMVLSTNVTQFEAVAYQGNFEQNVAKIASFGYAGVETAVRDPSIIDHDKIIGSITRHAMAIPAIGTGQAWGEEHLSFTDPDPKVRQKAVNRIASHVPLAQKAGAVIIIGLVRGIIQPGVSDRQAREWMFSSFKECAETAAAAEVRIAFEPLNRYETPLLNTAKEGLDFIDSVGADNLGLLLDTFHMNIEEVSIEESIRTCADRIFHFHVADSNRWYPGAGHLDFPSILEALASSGYSGWVSGEFMSLPDADTAARKALGYLKALGL